MGSPGGNSQNLEPGAGVERVRGVFTSPRMVRRRGFTSPLSSPQKERYGDRFIPSRAGNNWQVNFNMIKVCWVSPIKGFSERRAIIIIFA